jgi:hypothetical protein
MLRILFFSALVASALPALAAEPAAVTVERARRSAADLELGEYTFIQKLHILPCFRTPVFIEIYFGPKKSKVVAFRVDNAAPPQKVELVFERELDKWHNTGRPPREIDFFRGFYAMKEEEEANDYLGTDGETYILEIKDKDGVHRVKRWSPDAATKERDLEYFQSLCQDVAEQAGIAPRPVVHTE